MLSISGACEGGGRYVAREGILSDISYCVTGSILPRWVRRWNLDPAGQSRHGSVPRPMEGRKSRQAAAQSAGPFHQHQPTRP